MTGLEINPLTASAIGAAAKPLIAELVVHAKRFVKKPERVAHKALSTLELGKRIYNVINVKTLWSIEREVSLFEFYYPSRLIFPGEEAPRQVSQLSDFPGTENFVLEGTAGQGKSIYLRYLYGQLAFSLPRSKKIPLFVELRRVSAEKSVLNLIADAVERTGLPISDELLDIYLKSKSLILLCDGFDEVDFGLVSKTCDDIENLSSLYPQIRILITSRPDAAIQKSPHFRVAKVDPLKREDHLPFLERVCRDRTQAKEIKKAIDSSQHHIGGLLKTPLLLTLLVLLYRAQSAIPATLSRFYEQLFDVLFLKHDQTKPGYNRNRYTSLDEVQLKKLFEAFAFDSQISGKQIFSRADFQAHAEEAMQITGIEVSVSGFQKELVKTACLMVEDGIELSFTHKSVAEFYAASFVQKSSTEFASQFYSQLSDNGTYMAWAGELHFLQEIDSYRYAKHLDVPALKTALPTIRKNDLVSPEGRREDVLSRLFAEAELQTKYEEDLLKISGVLGVTSISTKTHYDTELPWIFLQTLFGAEIQRLLNSVEIRSKIFSSMGPEQVARIPMRTLDPVVLAEIRILIGRDLDKAIVKYEERLRYWNELIAREELKTRLVAKIKQKPNPG